MTWAHAGRPGRSMANLPPPFVVWGFDLHLCYLGAGPCSCRAWCSLERSVPIPAASAGVPGVTAWAVMILVMGTALGQP